MTCCRSLVPGAMWLCLLAAAGALPHSLQPVLAQTPAPVAEQVFTQIVNWKRVRGSAIELAIAANGAVFALGTQGEVWRWNGKESWSRLPGTLTRITVDPQGVPWGVDASGRVLQYRGNYWTQWPGTARDINIGSDGSLWMIGADGAPARWDASGGGSNAGSSVSGRAGGSAENLNPRDSQWRVVEPAIDALRIAGDPEGRPWIVTGSGAVFVHDGNTWVDLPGIAAKSIAIGPDGTVYAAGLDRRPWRYDRAGRRWLYFNGDVAAIAAGPRGQPWIANSQTDIYAASLFEEQREAQPVQAAAAGTKPPVTAARTAAGTLREPLGISNFQRIRDIAARDVAIGNDGSVFALAFDGVLARWSNTQNRFIAFPGQFARIAVEPGGRPWGVTTAGEVFRHDGTDWRVVPPAGNQAAAQDIAIGFNGAVIIADVTEALHRFNAAENRFVRMQALREGNPAPVGSRVAVDPRGRPWAITRDNTLWRCDRDPCERQAQKARDIDIGPEGSVFITDLDLALRRLDAASGEWQRIGIDAGVVAVGPGGRPWIVNARSEMFASTFFKREESGDTAVAAASSGNTTTATVPVFTFLINLPFDQVALPVGFASNGVVDIHLAFGPGGKLVVIDSAYAFWNYDASRRLLIRDLSIPSPVTALNTPLAGDQIRSFVIGTDGTYWITSTATLNPPNLWRRSGSQWISVPGLNDCPATPGCGGPSPRSVAVGPDGTIYASSDGNNIYRYDTSLLRFARLPLPRPNASGAGFVAVDPSGRFWAASPLPARLYEFVGNSWVQRTDAVIGAPGQCLSRTTPCVAISANGAAYGFGAFGRLVRWNAASGVWQTITSSPVMNVGGLATYAAAPDGRPWIWTGSQLFKAR